MIRELLRGVLEPEGYKVLEAEDGETALEIIEKETPGLLIVDIFLPGKGGLEIMGELTGRDTAPKIIAISGGDAFDPNEVLELTEIFEITATFTKPLDTDKLLYEVKQALGD